MDKNLVIWPQDGESSFAPIIKSLEDDDWELARKLLEIRIGDTVEDPIKVALFNNLGAVYQQLGLHNLALKNYEEADRHLAHTGNILWKGIVHFNIGYMFSSEARWNDAVNHLNTAINYFQQSEQSDFLALTERLLQETTSAKQHTMKVLETYKDKADQQPASKIERQREIARVYIGAGTFDNAICQLQEALDLSVKEGLTSLEAILLNDMAIIYRDQGQYERSLSLLEQALQKAITAEDRQTEASVRNNNGLVLKQMGRLSEAISMLQKALDIRRRLGDATRIGTVLYNLAATYHAMGHDHLALEYGREALLVDQMHDSESAQADEKLILEIEGGI